MKKFAARHSKVQRYLVYIFLIASAVPLTILGLFSIYEMRSEMLTHSRFQLHAETTRVNSVLFDLTTSIYTSTDTLFSQNEIMTVFGASAESASISSSLSDINTTLEQFASLSASISNAAIYTDNKALTSLEGSMSNIILMDDFSGSDWYEDINGHWGSWAYLTRNVTGSIKTSELSLIRRLPVPVENLSAYIVVNIDGNYLKSILGQSDYRIDISSPTGTVFYSTRNRITDAYLTPPEDLTPGSAQVLITDKIDGIKSLISYMSFIPYKTSGAIFIRVIDSSTYPGFSNILLIFILITLVAILIPSFIFYFYSRRLGARIDTLKEAMHQVRMGNYDIVDKLRGNDELTETFKDLKGTVQVIHENETRYYKTLLHEQELETEQQRMEFKMLASQINPHFLNNTLEMIRMQALSKGNRDVAKSIKLLANTLHYVLENTGTSFTTLTNELSYVKNYLMIQQLRFGDRVNYVFDIEEGLDTDHIMILPLLIQPVVENAISHGLEHIEHDGLITIRIMTEENRLLMRVSDNGNGMTQEKLETLRHEVTSHSSEDASHIGLYNINRRIHLLYGDVYGLTIDSIPVKGTVITLTIPKEPTHDGK